MECGDGVEADCVQVAVHIRPLILQEQLEGCKECISVAANEPQVRLGSHVFTFDRVYGSNAAPPSGIFSQCIAPLVDGLFQGYNATVLAYGQTGSGKTYTMGTGGNAEGIIHKAMQALFDRMEQLKDRAAFQLRVSFIEILKEDIHDLLDPTPPAAPPKPEAFTGAFGISRPTSPGKPAIVIRETSNGGITMPGVTEVEVSSLEEMSACLEQGSASRATGSTNMNTHSSRSHAIFTINMEQHTKLSDETSEDLLFAKLHLVDLAGSERAKRTGADGMRFKEGVHINKGLLALGNVISALGDDKKKKEGGHIPYRDSKLTRLLQDSLGGNSRTVMIACVSPADANAEETLNTLKYANRARNIKNRATVNRDSTAAELQRLRRQVEMLQNQLLTARSGSSADEFEILKQRVQWLEARNTDLCQELEHARNALHGLSHEGFQEPEEGRDANDGENATGGMKLLRNEEQDCRELLCCKEKGGILASRQEPEAALSAELQHAELQDNLDRELEELNIKLAQKEAEMKDFTNSNPEALMLHFEKKLVELEEEKTALQRERDVLLAELEKLASATDGQTQKVQELHLEKLKALEYQIAELKKKQDSQTQLIKQKQRSEEAAKRLQDDIHRIKQQKVQLQQKIKQESEQFRMWKVAREKELLQLKKEGRKNEYEMHKLRALQQHQKMVLQRKTEEAANASRRLKELLESRRSREREMDCQGSTEDKVLQEWFDHEVQVALRIREVRLGYEKQSEVRTVLANELARLRREEAFDKPRNGRLAAKSAQIQLLESMLNASSETLVTMASELSEAEEHGRWQQLKSISDVKAMLSLAFGAAVCARCDLKVKEAENKELSEKVIELTHTLKLSDARRSERERHQSLKEQAVAVALAAATKAAADAAVRCGLDELHCYHAFNCSMPKAKLQAGKLCKWKQSQRQRASLHLKWKWQKPWRLSEWGMGKGAAAYRFDVRHRDRWKRIKMQEYA